MPREPQSEPNAVVVSGGRVATVCGPSVDNQRKVSMTESNLCKRRDLRLMLRSPSSSSAKHYGAGAKLTGQTGIVYSPVTDLALNLGELSTSARFACIEDTPKRRISMSSDSSGTPVANCLRPIALEKHLSKDGNCQGSPRLLHALAGSQHLQDRFGSSIFSKADEDEGSPFQIKSAALDRFQSLPGPFCDFEDTPTSLHSRRLRSYHGDEDEENVAQDGGTPERHQPKFFLDDEESSQDSGVGLDKDGLCQISEFQFVQPKAPAPRRARLLSDDTNSPHRFSYSPKAASPRRHLDIPDSPLSPPTNSPVRLRKSSLTCKLDAEERDDGFMDLFDLEEEEGVNDGAPKGLHKLLSAPVVCAPKETTTPRQKRRVHRRLSLLQDEDQENMTPQKGSRRGLFRSPSAPRMLVEKSKTLGARPAPSFKCKRESSSDDELEEDDSPMQKRRKSVADGNVTTEEKRATPKLHRCFSASEAIIKSAMQKSEDQELIGDSSHPYSLPLIKGKHNDLKAITPHTVGQLLDGQFSDTVEDYIVVDCRYPYEYEGGHIQGAVNFYTKDSIYAEFIKSTKRHQSNSSSNRHSIIIFHCEFSSERGPKMARFLRNMDRDANKEFYPALHYPEVYLMEGGYKAFFESEELSLCQPPTYLPMLHQDHRENLRKFRCKSRSESHICEKGRSRLRLGFGIRS